MIEVNGLTKLYGSFVAVDELSFAVNVGEVLGWWGRMERGPLRSSRSLR